MTNDLNLASLLGSSAAQHPDRPAIVSGERTLDYGTVDLFARMFAGTLRRLGVQPGEHVALVLPNVPHFTVAFFGAQYAGNPVVPLNVMLTPDELAYHLDDSQAVAVVAWELFADNVSAAAARARSVRHMVVARADLDDTSAPDGWHNMVATMLTAPPVQAPHPTRRDDTAVVLYTSGTTGRPKGAELTHANLVFNARAIGELVDLDAGTVALVALPLFHAFGMTVMHNAVLAVGGSLVLLPGFDAATALDLMEQHRVTFFGGVPTMFIALSAAAPDGLALPALRWCVSGGAALPAPVMTALEERFGVAVLEGYGMSETSPVVSFTVPGRPRTPGSIGYPLPGIDVRLGERDEILVRGPGVMKGYWRKPADTAEAIVGGWLHTGDIGAFDEHGALRIVDRRKDLIIRGGYNVYPAEVEAVLHGHPAVAQAAVVGTPHSRLGEEVRAVVTLVPGTSATPAEIVAFCRTHLAAYKRPRIVEVWDRLPLSATGKVLKTEIRATRPAAGVVDRVA
jgi:long-chain acyl-CoA synthetase